MKTRHFLSKMLLGRRLTKVEELERQAYGNQQMILARKEQVISANKELCRHGSTVAAAFTAGGLTGLLKNKKPSSVPLILRLVGMAGIF
jgi:hypothetical protein